MVEINFIDGTIEIMEYEDARITYIKEYGAFVVNNYGKGFAIYPKEFIKSIKCEGGAWV